MTDPMKSNITVGETNYGFTDNDLNNMTLAELEMFINNMTESVNVAQGTDISRVNVDNIIENAINSNEDNKQKIKCPRITYNSVSKSISHVDQLAKHVSDSIANGSMFNLNYYNTFITEWSSWASKMGHLYFFRYAYGDLNFFTDPNYGYYWTSSNLNDYYNYCITTYFSDINKTHNKNTIKNMFIYRNDVNPNDKTNIKADKISDEFIKTPANNQFTYFATNIPAAYTPVSGVTSNPYTFETNSEYVYETFPNSRYWNVTMSSVSAAVARVNAYLTYIMTMLCDDPGNWDYWKKYYHYKLWGPDIISDTSEDNWKTWAADDYATVVGTVPYLRANYYTNTFYRDRNHYGNATSQMYQTMTDLRNFENALITEFNNPLNYPNGILTLSYNPMKIRAKTLASKVIGNEAYGHKIQILHNILTQEHDNAVVKAKALERLLSNKI